MKRGKSDLETSISFLCSRMSCSTEQDWIKLKRTLRFLNCTIRDERIIGIDDITKIHTYSDASYAVHNNMRSHTGDLMIPGGGVVHSRSPKQKLDSKSSIESEIIGVSDYLSYALWMGYFTEHQGYKLNENLVHQDNQSSIKMEVNGRNSCTGNSQHIKIRYFFTKDLVNKKEIRIEYCPPERILSDYNTKPL